MAKFMDVHDGFFGVTAEQLRDAHDADLAIEQDEGVHFERAWLDPKAGKVFCLATGPSREAVMKIHERAGHPTPEVYELTVEVEAARPPYCSLETPSNLQGAAMFRDSKAFSGFSVDDVERVRPFHAEDAG
jgi:hypothetical protein